MTDEHAALVARLVKIFCLDHDHEGQQMLQQRLADPASLDWTAFADAVNRIHDGLAPLAAQVAWIEQFSPVTTAGLYDPNR